MATDYSFKFKRTIPAGGAEAVPAITDNAVVWDLPDPSDHGGEYGALVALSKGAAISYELGFWDINLDTPTWIVIATGTLADGVPGEIPCAFPGARVYLRSTGVTAADTELALGILVTTPSVLKIAVDAVTTAVNAVKSVLDTMLGHTASMAEGTELAPADIAVQVYSPPLRWIHNYGTVAGTVTFKSKVGGTARPVYLAQGATLSVSSIQEVTAFTAGMTMTGGY